MAATLDNTIGILFQSVVFGAALYGAGCMQAWYYYRKYQRRDNWFTKGLVSIVLACDTAQMAILSASVYEYCVTNQGNPLILTMLEPTLIIEILFSNLIALIVQMFYVFRIYKLSEERWYRYPMTIFVFALSAGSFITLNYYCHRALQFATFAEFASLKTLSMSINIMAAVTDVAISLCLVFLLRKSANKSGFKRTNDMINRMIVFTFNTGLPTSIGAVMACVSINAWPKTFIYMFFFLMLGRFYTNSLLVTLNSRDYIRKAANGDVHQDSYSLSLQNAAGTHMGAGTYRPSNPLATRDDGIAIRIETVKQSDADYELDAAKSGSFPSDHDLPAVSVAPTQATYNGGPYTGQPTYGSKV